MKIAILSDLHDNLASLDLALKEIEKEGCDQMIFCGDLCAPSVLKRELGPKFKGRIHLVAGNVADFALTKKFADELENVDFYFDPAELEIDGQKIALSHFPVQAKDLARTNHYQLVCYGHTHERSQEKIGKTLLVNPGTVGGMFAYPTFAIYDTQTKEVKFKEIKF